MALASLDARAPPPPLPAPPSPATPASPSKYYAKVVIKGKPHFAPFLHSLRSKLLTARWLLCALGRDRGTSILGEVRHVRI